MHIMIDNLHFLAAISFHQFFHVNRAPCPHNDDETKSTKHCVLTKNLYSFYILGIYKNTKNETSRRDGTKQNKTKKKNLCNSIELQHRKFFMEKDDEN